MIGLWHTIYDWETIEFLITIGAVAAAIVSGYAALHQMKDERERLKDLEAWRGTQDRLSDAQEFRLQQVEASTEDHEARLRGIEKRRRTTK